MLNQKINEITNTIEHPRKGTLTSVTNIYDTSFVTDITEGSEKQIAWAKDIKETFVDRLTYSERTLDRIYEAVRSNSIATKEDGILKHIREYGDDLIKANAKWYDYQVTEATGEKKDCLGVNRCGQGCALIQSFRKIKDDDARVTASEEDFSKKVEEIAAISDAKFWIDNREDFDVYGILRMMKNA